MFAPADTDRTRVLVAIKSMQRDLPLPAMVFDLAPPGPLARAMPSELRKS